MFDYIIQNFNLASFALGMSAILILNALVSQLTAYLRLVKARQNEKLARKKMNEIRQKFKDTNEPLIEMMRKKESK